MKLKGAHTRREDWAQKQKHFTSVHQHLDFLYLDFFFALNFIPNSCLRNNVISFYWYSAKICYGSVCVALATLVEIQNKHLDSSRHIMGNMCQKPPVDKLLLSFAVALSFAE